MSFSLYECKEMVNIMKKIALFQPYSPLSLACVEKAPVLVLEHRACLLQLLGHRRALTSVCRCRQPQGHDSELFSAPLIAFLNLAPVLLLWVDALLSSGRAGLSCASPLSSYWALTTASWFKLQFRNDPLMFEDLLLLKEAGNMAGKYQLFLTKTMAAALLLVVLGWAALHFCARWRPRGRLRYLGFTLALVLCFPSALIQSDDIYNNRTENYALINRWSATRSIPPRASSTPFFTV